MTYLIHTSVKKKQRWFSHASGFMVHLPVLATSGTLNFLWKNQLGPFELGVQSRYSPCRFVTQSWAQFMEGPRNRTLGMVGSHFLAESLTITNTSRWRLINRVSKCSVNIILNGFSIVQYNWKKRTFKVIQHHSFFISRLSIVQLLFF